MGGRRLSGAPLVFLCVGPLCGALMILLTPPFQAPDEQVHLYRAYQISDAGWVGESHDGQTGAWLPASLPGSAEPFLRIRRNPTRKLTAPPVEAFSIPLEREKRRFIAFETTALYSPVPYLPQVLGISLGKLFDLGPLPLLYLCRAANLSVALALVFVALQVLPIFRWPMLLLALMPMSLFQMSSASADGFTNSVCFLFIALILRAVVRDGSLGRSESAVLVLVALLVSLSKPAYFPLTGLALAIPRRRFSTRRARFAFFPMLLLPSAVAVTTWAVVARSSYLPPSWIPNIDAAAQLETILAHPLQFVGMLLAQLSASAGHHANTAVGASLGSLDVALPLAWIHTYQVLLVAVALVDSHPGHRLTWRPKLLAAAIAVGNVILIWTLLYVDGTPVGADRAWGIQGRYFIPLSPLLLLPLYNRSVRAWLLPRVAQYRSFPRAISAGVLAFLLASSAVSCYAIIDRYYTEGALW